MTLNDLASVVMCQTNTYPRGQDMWPYEGLSNHWFPLMPYETLVVPFLESPCYASPVCPVSRGTFDQECFLEMMAPLGYQAHDSMTVVVSCPRISWTCPEFFVLFRG